MFRWFIALAVIVIAALWADRAPLWFRRVLLCSMVILIGFTIVEIISGVVRLRAIDANTFHEFHRWTAHGLVIAHWNFLFVGVGVAIAMAARQRWLVAVLIFVLPLVAMGICLLGSFTGYLHPRSVAAANEMQDRLNEETMNRFVVLHAVVLPAMLLGSQAGIVAVLWRFPKRAASLFPPDAGNY